MVIDDLQDIRLLDAVHRLSDFIMIHQDHFFSVHIEESPAGDQTHVVAAFLNDREVVEPVGFHNIFNVFDSVAHLERYQIFSGHKELHRHTLVD